VNIPAEFRETQDMPLEIMEYVTHHCLPRSYIPFYIFCSSERIAYYFRRWVEYFEINKILLIHSRTWNSKQQDGLPFSFERLLIVHKSGSEKVIQVLSGSFRLT